MAKKKKKKKKYLARDLTVGTLPWPLVLLLLRLEKRPRNDKTFYFLIFICLFELLSLLASFPFFSSFLSVLCVLSQMTLCLSGTRGPPPSDQTRPSGPADGHRPWTVWEAPGCVNLLLRTQYSRQFADVIGDWLAAN